MEVTVGARAREYLCALTWSCLKRVRSKRVCDIEEATRVQKGNSIVKGVSDHNNRAHREKRRWKR